MVLQQLKFMKKNIFVSIQNMYKKNPSEFTDIIELQARL